MNGCPRERSPHLQVSARRLTDELERALRRELGQRGIFLHDVRGARLDDLTEARVFAELGQELSRVAAGPVHWDLDPEQLQDLFRGAVGADDRRAYAVVHAARFDRDSMLLAILAWEGRCARTGGWPWLSEYRASWPAPYREAAGDRPCPGCAACSRPLDISDERLREMRDEARAVGDRELARACNAALGVPTGDGAGGLLDAATCRRRLAAAERARGADLEERRFDAQAVRP